MKPTESQFPEKKETPLETLMKANQAMEKQFNLKEPENKEQ